MVGAGTGYSAAVLEAIGLDGHGARKLAPSLPPRRARTGVDVVEGPLEAGWKKGAPYDQILIDGAVEYIPDAIVEQLADGGRLGAALVDRGITRLIVGRKAGGAFGYLSLERCGRPGAARLHAPQGFTF